jgi:CshA-type fibril repeat protein
VGPTAQDVTLAIPAHDSITLIAGGPPSTAVTVPGEGQYVLDPIGGLLTFTPDPAFSGQGTGVTFRLTDAYGQSATGTYRPTVTPPPGPTAGNLTSTGVGTSTHTAAAVIPAGDTITLLASGGSPATTLTVAGEGTYSLDTSSATITYTPLLGFAGTATGMSYRVADAYGQTATATYRPAVTMPPAPAAAPLTSTGVGTSPQSGAVIAPPDSTRASRGRWRQPDGYGHDRQRRPLHAGPHHADDQLHARARVHGERDRRALPHHRRLRAGHGRPVRARRHLVWRGHGFAAAGPGPGRLREPAPDAHPLGRRRRDAASRAGQRERPRPAVPARNRWPHDDRHARHARNERQGDGRRDDDVGRRLRTTRRYRTCAARRTGPQLPTLRLR